MHIALLTYVQPSGINDGEYRGRSPPSVAGVYPEGSGVDGIN